MMRKLSGFTLIELIVVISIMSILSAIAVPQYRGYIESAKKTKAVSLGEEIFCASVWSYHERDGAVSSFLIEQDIKEITSVQLNKVEISSDKIIIKLYYYSENREYAVEANMSLFTYLIREKESGAILYE